MILILSQFAIGLIIGLAYALYGGVFEARWKIRTDP